MFKYKYIWFKYTHIILTGLLILMVYMFYKETRRTNVTINENFELKSKIIDNIKGKASQAKRAARKATSGLNNKISDKFTTVIRKNNL